MQKFLFLFSKSIIEKIILTLELPAITARLFKYIISLKKRIK